MLKPVIYPPMTQSDADSEGKKYISENQRNLRIKRFNQKHIGARGHPGTLGTGSQDMGTLQVDFAGTQHEHASTEYALPLLPIPLDAMLHPA